MTPRSYHAFQRAYRRIHGGEEAPETAETDEQAYEQRTLARFKVIAAAEQAQRTRNGTA